MIPGLAATTAERQASNGPPGSQGFAANAAVDAATQPARIAKRPTMRMFLSITLYDLQGTRPGPERTRCGYAATRVRARPRQRIGTRAAREVQCAAVSTSTMSSS